ncbi:hypothetical protein [Nocardia otitidiscaviarum]|uniref:GRAM domain-containing protein n=1 Tax=Nocardia otitidiscaviarum TaxID=1823 RepID=A0A516NJ39_9NOCA|nr:hypothetical protein [Nocardia otitidiscaviarum]MBF6176908.1 hypothetical protein [Nocardia otitidiscaviarum]MCP9619633.1 hypothetical protein [Nocardia otitidiscaviarum]QDP78924.1 hypothetical protein FOH10_09415 [Nocardia otitidiscaviarum]
MGIWTREPTLDDGENVTWRRPANRTQGGRAVGGTLYLTSTRLRFEPNRMDALMGGRSWSAPRTSVTAVGTEARTGGLFDGGMRNRLRVDLREGAPELFVVGKLDETIETLRAALG